MNGIEIILRDCGKVGFIGLVMRGRQELYRTGSHWPNPTEAYYKVCDWMEQNDDLLWGKHAA